MQHLTIITALLMTFATQAVAVSGSMTCKVKTSYVVAIEEGIAKMGWRSSAKVGDTVTLSYTASFLGEFSMQLGKNLVRADIETSELGFSSGSGLNSYVFSVVPTGSYLNVGTDILEIESRWSYASFQRYYKNDWQGYVRTESSLNDKFEVHIATLTCRHNNDQLDEFINAMKRAG